TQSAVVGTIRDADRNSPLPGAVVALPALGRAAISDDSGRYVLHWVPPGFQSLAVRHVGYAERTLRVLVPRAGDIAINLRLDPLPVHLPAILVRSTVPGETVDPAEDTASPDPVVLAAALSRDPRLAEPDGLLGLTNGEVGASPESPSGLHIRGGSADQTAYVLDGVPVFNPYHSAGTFSAWNPDALDRLQVSSATPAIGQPSTLAGAVLATTLKPGPLLRTRGGVSTTQARLAADGPLGSDGAGYVVSVRTGLPDLVAPRNELSYIRGGSSDLLAKLVTPIAGGRLNFLAYDNRNALAATPTLDAVPANLGRNSFGWGGRSIGARWTGRAGDWTARLDAWSASTSANADWRVAGTMPVAMASRRRDEGAGATLQQRRAGGTTWTGVRLERSRTNYRVTRTLDGSSAFAVRAVTPVGTLFLRHARPLGPRLAGDLALSMAGAAGRLHLGIQSELRWRASALTLFASYAHSNQFMQSLRNPESVVGGIFPAELYVGTGGGVPVAGADRGVLALEYRPASGLRLGAQAYASRSTGLVLVAPVTGEPFAVAGFATGAGSAAGLSLSADVSGARAGARASYTWQRVHLGEANSSYVPEYGSSHLLELGAVILPAPGTSVRLAGTAAFGRRASGLAGAFEWEACNLLDRGCEFAGSPRAVGPPGALRLPPYLRFDLSARQEWRWRLAGRPIVMAVFGTFTNLLGRANVLDVVTDPTSGIGAPVEMRPRAPLVAGLDWRF
nr:carboxypeptidase-like regulatory domain-containing protein [Gemmatimonadales bacterium]